MMKKYKNENIDTKKDTRWKKVGNINRLQIK